LAWRLARRNGGHVTLPAFRYHRPSTVRAACELGRRLGESAAFLAGGTELIPDYHRGREHAAELIALRDIAELRGIAVEGDTLRVGSLTTVAELARSSVVGEWLPALAEAAHALGSPQVRARATVGGNFCRAVSCADLPPATLIGNATLRLATADETRDIDAQDFFLASRSTVLTHGELLVELRLPRPAAGSGTSFERFGLRRGLALAVASVAARVEVVDGRITDCAVALGAVAPTPMLVPEVASLLRGRRPTEALFARAAAVCADAARPISDIRGSAEFRREIVTVLARRALARATAVAVAARCS
jgi:carbon-monoxide dehydrogenase medium subunit